MIYTQIESDVAITGDYKSNDVGIDAKNMNFITTILTSNLYSHPIQSFFREIVSNAWDSHVEAGNADTPIIIRMRKDNSLGTDDISITIRDFGVGLSPERFDTIYRNIGSSTKRESNEYIGMLGLGRFVPLAITDTVSIKSFYNGQCYSYLMYKDGDTIKIDLLNTIETPAENGVEVSVNLSYTSDNLNKIRTSITLLSYFEKLYIDCKINDDIDDFINRFNNRKIKEYKTFKVCSFVTGSYFLMGNVLYEAGKFSDKYICEPNVAIKCDIGSLDITPNRENLRFTDKTNNYIEQKCIEVNKELDELIAKDRIVDYKTISSFKQNEDASYYYLTDDVCQICTALRNSVPANITINGIKVLNPKELKYFINCIYNIELPKKYILYLYKSITESFAISNLSITFEQLLRTDIYSTKTPYKPITKSYLRTILKRNSVFLKEEKIKYIPYFIARTLFYLQEISNYYIGKDLIGVILNYLLKIRDSIKPFNNEDVPKEYKDSVKRSTITDKKACTIYTLDSYQDRIIYHTEDLVFYANTYSESTIVYGEKGDKTLEAAYLLCASHRIKFIALAKSKVNKCNGLHNFIHINNFIHYNKRIAKLATIYKYNNDKKSIDRYIDIFNIETPHSFCLQEQIVQNLLTLYINNNWLDCSLVELYENKNIRQINEFVTKKYLYKGSMELNYYIYKNKLSTPHINYVSAYKFLNEAIS